MAASEGTRPEDDEEEDWFEEQLKIIEEMQQLEHTSSGSTSSTSAKILKNPAINPERSAKISNLEQLDDGLNPNNLNSQREEKTIEGREIKNVQIDFLPDQT